MGVGDRLVTVRTLTGLDSPAAYHSLLMGRDGERARRVGINPARISTPDKPAAAGPKAIAFVNHGRWVARCPAEDCGGAELLEPGWPFLCQACFNSDGRYIGVEWPENRDAIETLLVERPIPATRNWEPGEPVEHLLAENEKGGPV